MIKPDYKYTLRDLQLIKFGLRFGLIKKEEIIASADREILKDGTVDYLMNSLDYFYCNGIDEGWCSIEVVKKNLLEFLRQYNMGE